MVRGLRQRARSAQASLGLNCWDDVGDALGEYTLVQDAARQRFLVGMATDLERYVPVTLELLSLNPLC